MSTLLLALSLPALAALPDPWARLEFALELAAEPSSEEEAHDALLALGAVPEVAVAARAALVRHCLHEDARPGWLATYTTLASDPIVPPEDADRLSRRAAEARTWIASSRDRARENLAFRLARDPGDRDLQMHVARAHMNGGAPGKALAIFEMRPGDPEFLEGARLARLAMPTDELIPEASLGTRVREVAAGGYPELAAWMVAKEDPSRNNPAAWLARGDIRFERGRTSEAIADYASALRRTPDDRGLRVALTRANLALGRRSEAIAASGGDEVAVRVLRAVITAETSPRDAWALAPDETPVLLAYARSLAAEGDPESAFRLLEPLLDAPSLSTGALMTLTNVGLEAGEGEKVLHAWRLALVRAGSSEQRRRLSDEMADVWALLAELEKRRSDHDEAERSYMVALAMQPDDPGHLAGLGGVLWNAGKLDRAREVYAHAARITPSDTRLLASAAEISVSLGQYDQALALLQRGPATDPRLRQVSARAMAGLTVASLDASLRGKAPEERLAALRRAALTHRSDPEVVRAVADRMLDEGQPEEALVAYRRAQVLASRDPWARIGEARALARAGEYEAARASLELAATQQGYGVADAVAAASAEILRHEGDHLWRDEGRDADALARYAEALRVHPDAWTLAALGGLYLAHGQPAPAFAFYEAAIDADSKNVEAWRGAVRSLRALGRTTEARLLLDARRVSEPEILHEVEEGERADAIARIAELDALGDLVGARRSAESLLAEHPRSPDVLVASGWLALHEGDPGEALHQGVAALDLDPSHGEAMQLCLESGRVTGQLAEVLLRLDEAARRGGGAEAAAYRDRARLAAQLEEVSRGARRGDWAYSRMRLQRVQSAADEDPDALALVGETWLGMDDVRHAREAYARALEMEPENTTAILGLAALELSEGRTAAARAWLQSRFEDTGDTRIGLELARTDVRAGSTRRARETLEEVREILARGGAKPAGGLPVVALPSGEVPSEPTVASAGSALELEGARQVERLMVNAGPIEGGAVGGLLGHAGEVGANQLQAEMAGATFEHALFGPFRAEASVVALGLHDGARDERGTSAAIGLSTTPGSRLGAAGMIGTSPVGFGSEPYATWLANGSWRPDRRVELIVDTGRAPVTDSLASWAGAGDFGNVSSTWVGGTALLRTPMLFDAGVQGRLARLEGLGMDMVGRRELTGWAGKRFGPEDRWVGVGATGTLQGHDREIDAFEVGSGGVYSPLEYRAGYLRLEGAWHADGAARVCGGVAAGVQDITGDSFIGDGSHPSVSARVGGSTRLASRWEAGVTARYDAVGSDWTQQSAMLWLMWRDDPRRAIEPALPEIHGASVRNATTCR